MTAPGQSAVGSALLKVGAREAEPGRELPWYTTGLREARALPLRELQPWKQLRLQKIVPDLLPRFR